MAQFWRGLLTIVNKAADLKRTHFVIASAARQSRQDNGHRSANRIATSLRSSQ